ncbi:hypothetical protein DPEC_G00211410 [Dallia pectoralis]|uniref:Uncharacterized protein n=1 Tax=Dallia pectoralis TaxID=75939 RepID=A0ACC2G5M6_DALPE|nr:hypothetical protein DPEC_G00211410 [Dallia pectoralis]
MFVHEVPARDRCVFLSCCQSNKDKGRGGRPSQRATWLPEVMGLVDHRDGNETPELQDGERRAYRSGGSRDGTEKSPLQRRAARKTARKKRPVKPPEPQRQ